VILHGIGDPLSKELAAAPVQGKAAKISFGYVGRFVPEKGIAVLVEAARLLKEENLEFEIRLVGDGPERKELEEKIARYELKSNVRITGFLTGAALRQEVEDIGVMVMPSVCEETSGLAAMEQMMLGRLVIASDIGGLGETVGDAALRFPPGQPRALAEVIKKVLEEPALVQTYGIRARERALHFFALERMIAEHAGVYRGAIRSPGG